MHPDPTDEAFAPPLAGPPATELEGWRATASRGALLRLIAEVLRPVLPAAWLLGFAVVLGASDPSAMARGGSTWAAATWGHALLRLSVIAAGVAGTWMLTVRRPGRGRQEDLVRWLVRGGVVLGVAIVVGQDLALLGGLPAWRWATLVQVAWAMVVGVELMFLRAVLLSRRWRRSASLALVLALWTLVAGGLTSAALVSSGTVTLPGGTAVQAAGLVQVLWLPTWIGMMACLLLVRRSLGSREPA